jgi:hypothetical protein
MTGKSIRAAMLACAIAALAAVPGTASADSYGMPAGHDFVAGLGELPLSPDGFANYFAFAAFSTADGSNPGGYLIVSAPETGQRFTGFVKCVNVSGKKASLVMTFDSHIAGQPDKFKGAVFWVQDNGTNLFKPTDTQRNFRLTQAQLDTTYATCPAVTPPADVGPEHLILKGDIVVHDA